MGDVMGEGDQAIQEALYCHEMFEPSRSGGTRYGLEHIMRTEATWAFTQEQIQDALTELHREQFVHAEGGYWCASTEGRIARERLWQKKGLRHPALRDASVSPNDLILALIASDGDEYQGHEHPSLPEQQLNIHLPDMPVDTKQAVLQELVTEGLIRRGTSPVNKDVAVSMLTAKGLRVYAQQVVPRLALQPPATILAAKEPVALPFDELGLSDALADNLRYRWEEADRCMGARAWLAANILFGSILEVVLPDWLDRVSPQATAARAAPRDKSKTKTLPIKEWKLSDCINVAAELQLIDSTLTRHADALRQTRNLIHPDRQMSERSQPEGGTTAVSRQVVLAILEAMARTTAP